MITRQTVADKLAAYLHHELALDAVVDWAEGVMMDGELADADADVLRDVIARLGVADVRQFGLSWDDCESLLKQLGYDARIHILPSKAS
jgi:hypothetical protein